MGTCDVGSPAVASISFTSLSRQGRAETVCQQPSNISGNAYRTPTTALGFQSVRRSRVQKPPGFIFNKQQQARRWLSGIGVGNGGFIFVRFSSSVLPPALHGVNGVEVLISRSIVLRCCVTVKIYSWHFCGDLPPSCAAVPNPNHNLIVS